MEDINFTKEELLMIMGLIDSVEIKGAKNIIALGSLYIKISVYLGQMENKKEDIDIEG